jgi:hypothetical protein
VTQFDQLATANMHVKKGIGERAKKTQFEFRLVIIEFAEKEPEDWIDAFLELPHHMQDDLRIVAALLMRMQHENLITQLVNMLQEDSPDYLQNSLDLSEGTMQEVRASALRRPNIRPGKVQKLTHEVVRASRVNCVSAECFVLGVEMTFCDLPRERLEYYFKTCDDICSIRGQVWIIGRLLDEQTATCN